MWCQRWLPAVVRPSDVAAMKLLTSWILLCLTGDAAAKEVLTTSPLVVILGLVPVILVALYVLGVWIYREVKAWLRKKNARRQTTRK